LLEKEFLLFKFRLVSKKIGLVTRGVKARVEIRSILFGDFALN